MSLTDGQHVSHAQCARYIVQEAARRGEGGILYIKCNEWAYLLPHEWPDGAFRDRMEEVVDADGGNSFFVVVHSAADHINVFCIGRRQAAVLCMSGEDETAQPVS